MPPPTDTVLFLMRNLMTRPRARGRKNKADEEREFRRRRLCLSFLSSRVFCVMRVSEQRVTHSANAPLAIQRLNLHFPTESSFAGPELCTTYFILWWRALGQHTIEVVNKHTLMCVWLVKWFGPGAPEKMSTHTWQTNNQKLPVPLASSTPPRWLVIVCSLTLGGIFIEVTPVVLQGKKFWCIMSANNLKLRRALSLVLCCKMSTTKWWGLEGLTFVFPLRGVRLIEERNC